MYEYVAGERMMEMSRKRPREDSDEEGARFRLPAGLEGNVDFGDDDPSGG